MPIEGSNLCRLASKGFSRHAPGRVQMKLTELENKLREEFEEEKEELQLELIDYKGYVDLYKAEKQDAEKKLEKLLKEQTPPPHLRRDPLLQGFAPQVFIASS